MDEPIVVLDSNVIVYHLNEELDLAAFLPADCEKHISIVTEIEVLAKPGMTPTAEQEAQAFLADCVIEDISPAIKQKAIAIRRGKGPGIKKLKLPDAVIAATGVILNAPVLSKDSDLVRYEWPGFRSQEVV
jgi:predicted nucleic acid-binding protein